MDDLQQFKEQLFKELESLLKPHASLSKIERRKPERGSRLWCEVYLVGV